MIYRWVLITLLSLPSSADAALVLSDILENMEQKQSALSDVSFDFVQTVKQGSLPAQRTAGQVKVKKPHALRVDQKSPDKQTLVSDGKTFWLYSPAAQQQLKGNWQAWLEQSKFPLPLLDFLGTFTPERWRTQYKVLFGGYANGLYELQFKPLHADDLPVTLWISEETFLPAKGRLTNQGAQIDVEIKGMRVNTGLDAKVFIPKVPTGTTVVPIQL